MGTSQWSLWEHELEEGLHQRVWQTYVEECRQRGHEVMDPTKDDEEKGYA